jgi:hypothetical protein
VIDSIRKHLAGFERLRMLDVDLLDVGEAEMQLSSQRRLIHRQDPPELRPVYFHKAFEVDHVVDFVPSAAQAWASMQSAKERGTVASPLTGTE